MGQIVSDVTDILEYNKDKKAAKNQRQEILQKMQADEVEKTNLVKKVLATQRAKYGASGVSGHGVTEGAVLRRLKSETEQPYDEKRRNNMEKLKGIRATKPNILKKILARFDELM
jgi:hypothetical protein